RPHGPERNVELLRISPVRDDPVSLARIVDSDPRQERRERPEVDEAVVRLQVVAIAPRDGAPELDPDPIVDAGAEIHRQAVLGAAFAVLVRAPQALVPVSGGGRVLDRPRIDDEAGEGDRAGENRHRYRLRLHAGDPGDEVRADDRDGDPEDEEEDLQGHRPGRTYRAVTDDGRTSL